MGDHADDAVEGDLMRDGSDEGEGGMKEEEWKELEVLDPDSKRAEELLEKTEAEREHPEWYEGACYCRYCMECACGD